jgi:signal transduction histidine kinase
MSEISDALKAQRTELAGQVHDQIIPPLFAARMQLESLAAKIHAQCDAQRTIASDTLIANLDQATELVVRSMAASRELLAQWLPPVTGQTYWDQQLAVINRLLENRVRQALPTPTLSVVGELPWDSLDPEVSVAATNIATEAIRNAIRHAQATRIDVSLDDRHAAERHHHIVIVDDGVGFDTAARSGHHGLVLMKARADAIGGVLDVTSRPGGPTRVCLRWPASA